MNAAFSGIDVATQQVGRYVLASYKDSINSGALQKVDLYKHLPTNKPLQPPHK